VRAHVSLLALLLWAAPAAAQGGEAAVQPAQTRDFASAAADVQRQLEESLSELEALRAEIAAETVPLAKELRQLEEELSAVRGEFQQASRLLDTRTLDLSKLQADLEAHEREEGYLENLFAEYLRNFESRLHIAELQRYEERLEEIKLAPEKPDLSKEQLHRLQAGLLSMSLDRLEDSLGGARFAGTAVDADGLVQKGTFALVGPVALFRSDDGRVVGTAEQRLGSLEPAALAFTDPLDAAAAERLLATGAGELPLDVTLGNAHKIEATQETQLEHIQRGGPVMVPIFALAGLALLVALWKWLTLLFVRRPSRKRVEALLQAVDQRDEEAARARVQAIRGPAGRMLAAGVEHMREPRELIEEVMYEAVLTTRLKLQSFLPFISISAASAPLLGLLGTVTGIIQTFKMITVYGSGDVKSLSGGISEALITTEYGLIVAIPSLLLHAYLSRKARGITDQMEKVAVAFANRVDKSHYELVPETPRGVPAPLGGAAPDPALVRSQVTQILGELLEPLVDEEKLAAANGGKGGHR